MSHYEEALAHTNGIVDYVGSIHENSIRSKFIAAMEAFEAMAKEFDKHSENAVELIPETVANDELWLIEQLELGCSQFIERTSTVILKDKSVVVVGNASYPNEAGWHPFAAQCHTLSDGIGTKWEIVEQRLPERLADLKLPYTISYCRLEHEEHGTIARLYDNAPAVERDLLTRLNMHDDFVSMLESWNTFFDEMFGFSASHPVTNGAGKKLDFTKLNECNSKASMANSKLEKLRNVK